MYADMVLGHPDGWRSIVIGDVARVRTTWLRS